MSLNYTPVKRAKAGGPEVEPIIPISPAPVEGGDDSREKGIPPEAPTDKEVPDPVVTEHPDTVILTDDVKASGAEAVPNPTALLPGMQLEDEQIYEALDAPIESPLRWLGEKCKKALLKAGVMLKKAHGHVLRVMRPTS